MPKSVTRCPECGGAITAEVQKGHTYYRCTKKNVIRRRCTQPYVREKSLATQISKLLLKYTLHPDWADHILALLDGEEKQAARDSAALVAQKQTEVQSIQLKIGRLIEMRLDAGIDAKTYTERRANLMSQKRTLEEEITRLSKGQKPWLEPFRNWILDARNLAKIAETGSLSERKVLAKKVFGSNLFLDLKRARGMAVKAWPILADNEYNRELVAGVGFEPTTFRL